MNLRDDLSDTPDKELGGLVDIADDYAAIQRDLDKLKKWADRNLVKFSKGNNSKHQDAANLLESSSAGKKALGVLAGQQRTLRAKTSDEFPVL